MRPPLFGNNTKCRHNELGGRPGPKVPPCARRPALPLMSQSGTSHLLQSDRPHHSQEENIRSLTWPNPALILEGTPAPSRQKPRYRAQTEGLPAPEARRRPSRHSFEIPRTFEAGQSPRCRAPSRVLCGPSEQNQMLAERPSARVRDSQLQKTLLAHHPPECWVPGT